MHHSWRTACGLVSALVLTCVAAADQHLYTSQSAAQRASETINPGATIQLYCAQCADPERRMVAVHSIQASETGYQDYWQVLVNGDSIDLAYTYIERGGRWENLAMLLGLEVIGSPRYLDSDAAVDDPAGEALARLRSAEADLAGQLRAISAELAEQDQELLDRTQEAWLEYRDRMLEYEISRIDHEGEIERAQAFILERLTRARITDLEHF